MEWVQEYFRINNKEEILKHNLVKWLNFHVKERKKHPNIKSKSQRKNIQADYRLLLNKFRCQETMEQQVSSKNSTPMQVIVNMWMPHEGILR